MTVRYQASQLEGQVETPNLCRLTELENGYCRR